MDEYCPNCESALNENIKSGKLELICDNCYTTRDATDLETLRMEVNINQREVFTETAQELVDDHVNSLIDIDCKCGCKIGVMKTSGPQLSVVKVCMKCLAQI